MAAIVIKTNKKSKENMTFGQLVCGQVFYLLEYKTYTYVKIHPNGSSINCVCLEDWHGYCNGDSDPVEPLDSQLTITR